MRGEIRREWAILRRGDIASGRRGDGEKESGMEGRRDEELRGEKFVLGVWNVGILE